MTLVRVGPVHFQPLEQELAPVAKYLGGHVLNAGCGTRDIAPFLRSNGAAEITRYDIASSDPDVVVGPLESMPFGDAAFDSILCNAVLEHVHDADRAMRELARVVRVGGHVVVAVPFLQPYHAAPGDYRRYTADGLAQLGRNAGLEVVEVLPVHSFAQTLGWMLWEYAAETRGWIARRVLWLIAFLLTRFRTRTDPALRKNANTFQAVFRRPESLEANVIGTEWRRKPVPAACTSVPTMLVPDELRLLNHLAEEVYRGDGAIVDGGAFLGGSTVALADGLLRNPRRWRFGAEKRIHSFDRFEVEEYMRGLFFPESTPIGTSFRAEFERNIAPVADLVEVHAGDLRDSRWNGGPIEILFIDIAKTPRTCDWITRHFFPHLIPGRSLVVQQDYLYGCWTAWLQVTMELYADCFEYVCDTEVNSVVFRNIKPVPPDGPLLRDLSIDEQSALMDRAASRFTGRKREILRAAKQHFMENVASRYDSVSGGVACGND